MAPGLGGDHFDFAVELGDLLRRRGDSLVSGSNSSALAPGLGGDQFDFAVGLEDLLRNSRIPDGDYFDFAVEFEDLLRNSGTYNEDCAGELEEL